MRRNELGRKARAIARAFGFFSVLALVLGAGAPASAQRQGDMRFTVRPAQSSPDDPRTLAWLIHRGRPGDLVRDAVLVENLGSVPLRLELYPSDAVTADSGQFALEPGEAPDEDVAAWVHLRRDFLSLAPGERTLVPFTVRVPDQATPGDHVGGIVARNLSSVSDGPVRTLLAIGARLYFRVPGPIVEDLRVSKPRTEVENGRVRFLLDLENRGNTLIDVDAAYRLEALLGGDANREVGNVATLVPGARATIAIDHPNALPGGPVDASFTLRYGDGREGNTQISFFVMPPWSVLIAALLVVLSGIVLGLGRRRARAAAAVA